MTQSTATVGRWREVLALLERVLSTEQSARQSLIDSIKAEQPELYPQLLTLLAADQSAESANFIDQPPRLADNHEAEFHSNKASEFVGSNIGPYRVLRHIGSGGMGQVWLAERADGRYSGEVAIKLLRSCGDPIIAKRFEREGQLLARLQHPNIARLLDAGALPNGQLYLVLEYVDGDRIDRYFDDKRLTVAERVRAFLPVCDAVAYAHTQLVVHRDLKPSNIWVARDGTVKLLDFGIAKLIAEQHDEHATELTQLAGRAFTPDFAAPEQIRGDAVSTQTDVYALGAIAYRLLAGVEPRNVKTESRTSTAHRTNEAESPAMSAALTQRLRSGTPDHANEAALDRGVAVDRLVATLRGDLDTVIGKALKIDPNERYRSVGALRDDLQRYLDHQPVSARPDHAAYLAKKFVYRHKIGVAASAALIAAISAGVGGTLWQARIANERFVVAEQNAAKAREFERVARSEAERAARGEASAKEQALRAELAQVDAVKSAETAHTNESKAREQTAVAQRFRAQAQAEAQSATRELARSERVSSFLTAIFRESDPLSRSNVAARSTPLLLADAVEQVEQQLADDPLAQTQMLQVLADAQLNLSELAAAKKTLNLAERNLSKPQLASVSAAALRADTLASLGALALRETRKDDAQRYFQNALAEAAKLGARSLSTARVHVRHASTLLILTQFKDALGATQQAHQIFSERLGKDHPESLSALTMLASVHEQLRDDKLAQTMAAEVVALTQQRFGSEHARLVRPLLTLGEIARRQRNFVQASMEIERAISIAQRRFGDKSEQLSIAFGNRAAVERDAGEPSRAVESLRLAEAALPDGDVAQRSQILSRRGGIYGELDQTEDAIADLRESLRLRKAAGGSNSGIAWFTQAQLAEAIGRRKTRESGIESEQLFDEAASELRRLLGPDAYQNALIAARRGSNHEIYQRWDDAAHQYAEAVRLSQRVYGPGKHFGQLAWGLAQAKVSARSDSKKTDAARIADTLIAEWRGNAAGGREYVNLILFRCELLVAAGEASKARALCTEELAKPGLDASAEQLAALQKFAP